MRETEIHEVESAKALMTEAMTWSVMKWLREKKRVRTTADQANAVLDDLSEKVRGLWPFSLRDQYERLRSESANCKAGPIGKHSSPNGTVSAQVLSDALALKDADDSAHRARLDAEATFDEAEKRLSTALAREGCRKAIRAWELHEQAIRKSQQFIFSK
jgi:hypothetical protein